MFDIVKVSARSYTVFPRNNAHGGGLNFEFQKSSFDLDWVEFSCKIDQIPDAKVDI